MQLPPNLSCDEWREILELLEYSLRKSPKDGNFELYYDASSYSFDAIYHDCLCSALQSQSAVSQLVAEFESRGAWPRGKYEAKFWLRARLGEAIYYVREILELSSDLAIRCDDSLPTDVLSVREWLLCTHWEQLLAEFWIMENLCWYVHLTNPLDEQHEIDFENWKQEVMTGAYRRKRLSGLV